MTFQHYPRLSHCIRANVVMYLRAVRFYLSKLSLYMFALGQRRKPALGVTPWTVTDTYRLLPYLIKEKPSASQLCEHSESSYSLLNKSNAHPTPTTSSSLPKTSLKSFAVFNSMSFSVPTRLGFACLHRVIQLAVPYSFISLSSVIQWFPRKNSSPEDILPSRSHENLVKSSTGGDMLHGKRSPSQCARDNLLPDMSYGASHSRSRRKMISCTRKALGVEGSGGPVVSV